MNARNLYGSVARVAAFALMGAFATPVTAAPTCAERHDQAALNVSVLRAELMVAALYCGRQHLYNEFVTAYQTPLVEQGHALRAFFARSYGGAAEPRLNRFVTRLANEASLRCMTGRAQFCAAASRSLRQLLDQERRELAPVLDAAALSAHHGIASCAAAADAAGPAQAASEGTDRSAQLAP